ncbi:MAG: serine hydrolase [Aureliella sp.]
MLEPLATAHAGDVSVSVRVLAEDNNVTCEWYYNGQRVMPTASLIKLPIMIEAYRQVAAGAVSLDDMLTLKAEDQVPGSGILTDHFSPGMSLSLRDAIRLMIRYSDNTATNLVVDHIGLPSTSKTMAELGFPETQLHSKVFRRDSSIAPQRSEIYGLGSTTAEDMTDLLVRIERGELVESLQRTLNARIAAGLGVDGDFGSATEAAGACLIAVRKLAQGAGETIVVVLGSTSSSARYVDARNLFAWSWRKR